MARAPDDPFRGAVRFVFNFQEQSFRKNKPRFPMMNSMIFLVFAIVALISATNIDFKNCDTNGAVTVQSVDVSPDPVVSGQNLDVKASGTSTMALSSGTIEIAASVFGVTVLKENKDLCDCMSCPVDVGEFSLNYAYALDSKVPAFKNVEIKVTGIDNSSAEIFCISFVTDIVKDKETIILA